MGGMKGADRGLAQPVISATRRLLTITCHKLSLQCEAFRPITPLLHYSITPYPHSSLGQGLVQFLLIEEPFFGLERAGVNDPDLFAVRPIDAEDAHPAG